MAQTQLFPTGQVAVRLDEFGCGFCYYASGRVAVCVNKINDYQSTFQFYEDNAKRTLLATLDEHAIGSAGRPGGTKLILSRDGGIITGGDDSIVKSWKWDPKAQHAGSPPTDPFTIHLNDCLMFTYRDRSAISVNFAPGAGISVDFACGERLRRTTTYLSQARRAMEGPLRGKLLIGQQAPTLQERQKQIELDALKKRSKQKPRSKDLGHDQIKEIVAGLERKFDEYEGCKVTPAADGDWREKAHAQTLREVPVLPRTGFEIGPKPTLRGATMHANDASDSLARLRDRATAKWLGSVEIHEKIVDENPSLRRSGPLTNASGRYSTELAVPGGGVKPPGKRLPVIPGGRVRQFVEERANKDEMIVVACLRTDDSRSRSAEAVLEQVQVKLTEESSDASPTNGKDRFKCSLVKCDLTESPVLVEQYRILAVPTFIMFYSGKLVHVSSLGGAPLRVTPATKNASLSALVDRLPRVLLIEKCSKQQIAVEKILRKEEFQWDLASSGEQAAAFLSRLPSEPRGVEPRYDVVLVSDRLDESEVRSMDRLLRHKATGGGRVQSRPTALVCVVISGLNTAVQLGKAMCEDCRRAQGRRTSAALAALTTDRALACPYCGLLVGESARTAILPPALADLAQAAVFPQVKAATMHRLVERWAASRPAAGPSQRGDNDSHMGLSVAAFLEEVQRQLAAAKRGVFLPDQRAPSMALSAADTVLGHHAGVLVRAGAASASSRASSA